MLSLICRINIYRMELLMTYEKFLQKNSKRKSSDYVDYITSDFNERGEEYISDLIVAEFETRISSNIEVKRVHSTQSSTPSYLRSGTVYPGLIEITYNDYKIRLGLNSTRAKITCSIYDNIVEEWTGINFPDSTTVDTLIDKLVKAFKKLDKITNNERISKKALKKFNV